jgi:hypothetical protein
MISGTHQIPLCVGDIKLLGEKKKQHENTTEGKKVFMSSHQKSVQNHTITAHKFHGMSAVP